MHLLKLLILMLALSMVACSNKSTTNEKGDDLSESVVLSDDIDSDLEELEGIEIIDDEATEAMGSDGSEAIVSTSDEIIVEDSSNTVAAPPAVMSGKVREYVVQKNDTLMWIAFKMYGDYTKWRHILKHNPGLSSQSLAAGTSVKYEAPEEEFNWNPQGDPYLIVKNDTLGVISNKVYGTNKKWKSLWENNKPMIRDPNLIFAGFTIYYLPDGKMAMNEK